jgi:ABC-type transport system involved in multi-copper enzyme maturation permease subunit
MTSSQRAISEDEAAAESLAEAAPTPSRRCGTAALLSVLIRKELGDHLHGRRFIAGAIICILLCSIAAVVRLQDYRQAHAERSLFLQRWEPSIREQIDREEIIEVENTRAVSPLSVLSNGLEPITPFRFTSTKEGLRFGQSRGAQNVVDALFGALDLTFVVAVVLSLLAIALTFDSICGERSGGTLALLLSYAVPGRVVLLAKIGAVVILVVMCFVPSFLLTMLIMLAGGAPLLSGLHWLAFLGVALLYLTLFVVIGVGVSARRRTPTDAALASLFIWVVFVFVAPRAIGLFVGIVRPSAKTVELTLREEEMMSRIRTEHARKMRKAYEQYITGGGDITTRMNDFLEFRKRATNEFRETRRKLRSRLWEEQDREELLRERWLLSLSFLSPTALLNQVAAELSWTGFGQRQHFRHTVQVYDETIGRRLAESTESFTARTSRLSARHLVTHDDIRPYLVPYKYTWIDSGRVLGAIVFPLLAMVLFVVAALGWAIAGFAKLDVRP